MLFQQTNINFCAMNSKCHLEFHFKMKVTTGNILSGQERSWLGVHVDDSPELCTTSRGDGFSRLPGFPFLNIISPVSPATLPQTQNRQTETKCSGSALGSSTQFAAQGFASLCPLGIMRYILGFQLHMQKIPTEHNSGCGFTGSSSQHKVAPMLKVEVRASRYSHTPALTRAFVLQPQGHGMSPDQSTNLVGKRFLSF